MEQQGRIMHSNWDLYDTRHCVFHPAKLKPQDLEAGYRRAYREFYRWGSIIRSAAVKDQLWERLRHLSYSAGWKKFEGLWNIIIRARQVSQMLPLLERILNGSRESLNPGGFAGRSRKGMRDESATLLQ
jgi:hypothetical protein